MRTAIVGAGSLGIIIGAYITKGGVPLELIDVDKANVDALNAKGATVTGWGDLNIPVKARTMDQLEGKYDLVILLTKQVSNKDALGALLPYLHDKSTVCTLQNGIPEPNVAEIVGKERTIGGAVGFGATWLAPGVSELTSAFETMRNFAFDIGEMDGKITRRLKDTAAILEHVGKCLVIDNLMSVRWSKVLMNTTFSGMSAALGCTFGDVLHNDTAMYQVCHIADETVKAAKASGYSMAYMQDYDFNLFEMQNGDADIPQLLPVYRRIWAQHVRTKASMLQDMEKKRKCEIEYINGEVCKAGRKYGLATPANDMVVKLVKEAEAAGIVPKYEENLKRFAAKY